MAMSPWFTPMFEHVQIQRGPCWVARVAAGVIQDIVLLSPVLPSLCLIPPNHHLLLCPQNADFQHWLSILLVQRCSTFWSWPSTSATNVLYGTFEILKLMLPAFHQLHDCALSSKLTFIELCYRFVYAFTSLVHYWCRYVCG